MKCRGGLFPAVLFGALVATAQANASIQDVKRAFGSGQYFTAARIAFNDANQSAGSSEKAMNYAWATESLVRAGLDQAAVYFFIRTLQFQDRAASRKVLELTSFFMDRAGPDLLKKFLFKYTRPDDYSAGARNAYHLAFAKDRLLHGDYAVAIESAGRVQPGHSLYPLAMQIRGSAKLMLNKPRDALRDFEICEDAAEQRNPSEPGSIEDQLKREQPEAVMKKWNELRRNAGSDLKARCIANQARVLYELGDFEEADRKYGRIPKSSFVWTDTLFEHAWNSYAREEYNRALGKLVSYKSPILQFTFNSEIDVLMAQSYLALCLYDDAARIVNDFSGRVSPLALEVKSFVEICKAQGVHPGGVHL
ncbi:MAG: hypothetical protein EBX52_09060, partial [Proteobacteria bacterium]|nr:hypothetical protein [Pseudomonadota bacterium]